MPPINKNKLAFSFVFLVIVLILTNTMFLKKVDGCFEHGGESIAHVCCPDEDPPHCLSVSLGWADVCRQQTSEPYEQTNCVSCTDGSQYCITTCTTQSIVSTNDPDCISTASCVRINTYEGTCPSSEPYCGDGTCDDDESYLSCPSDCDPPDGPSCSVEECLNRGFSAVEATCNNICSSNLRYQTGSYNTNACISDICICCNSLCGNGTCDPEETCTTCPSDCGVCLGSCSLSYCQTLWSDTTSAFCGTYLDCGGDEYLGRRESSDCNVIFGLYCNCCKLNPISVGYISIMSNTGIIKLDLISSADAELLDRGVIKVARFVGDKGTVAHLVETNDPLASPVRVRTPHGIKAWRINN